MPTKTSQPAAAAEESAPAEQPVAASAARAVERLTHEEWATKKGMLPETIPGGSVAVQMPRGQRAARVNLAQTAAVAPRHNWKYAPYAAAKAMFQWPIGLVMSEADFEAALVKAYGDVKLS